MQEVLKLPLGGAEFFMRGLLLTLAYLASFAAPSLHAQSGESHQPIPRTLDRKAAVDLLGGALSRVGADRDQLHGDLNALGRLLQAVIEDPKRFGITEDTLKDLARKDPKDLGVDPNDPNVQALARKLAEQIKPDPDQAALLKRLIGDLKPPQNLEPPKIVPPPDVGVPPPVDPVKPGDPPRDGSKPLAIESRPKSATPPTRVRRSSKSWLSKQLSELRPGSPNLSEGLTKRLLSLFGRDSRVTGRGRDLGRDPSRIVPRFNTPLIRNLPDRIAPNVPRVNLPSAPSLSAPSMPSGEGLNAGALAILVLVVGFVVLMLWPKTRGWITGRGDPWRLGPWPIAPSAVRTRQDLIKAFEYLALLLLGRKAEATNHLDIAQQLGRQPEATSQHRAAANELADLYEQSRYAPPQGELTADEVATARRDLCFLAGVARA